MALVSSDPEKGIVSFRNEEGLFGPEELVAIYRYNIEVDSVENPCLALAMGLASGSGIDAKTLAQMGEISPEDLGGILGVELVPLVKKVLIEGGMPQVTKFENDNSDVAIGTGTLILAASFREDELLGAHAFGLLDKSFISDDIIQTFNVLTPGWEFLMTDATTGTPIMPVTAVEAASRINTWRRNQSGPTCTKFGTYAIRGGDGEIK